jgi:Zn-dependent M28 family amino/carboxypeptidase
MKKWALLLPLLAIMVVIVLIILLNHGPIPDPGEEGASPFSGTRALEHVEDLVKMGPRSIGSAPIVRARTYIVEHLEELGVLVRTDPFTATYEGTDYEMVNIVGIIPGSGEGVIAVGGHYDTKDIPGANDGGSSAGLLLEMARVLANESLGYTIWIVFFDGEDTGNDMDTMFYGSRYMASELSSRGELPDWLIIADMIGDRNLLIKRDRNSNARLQDYIWRTAGELGYDRHFGTSTLMVLDDHVPFGNLGVPSCVLIDFEYGPLNSYWHTQRDDMDKINGDSLKVVGDVLYHVVIGLDGGELNG